MLHMEYLSRDWTTFLVTYSSLRQNPGRSSLGGGRRHRQIRDEEHPGLPGLMVLCSFRSLAGALYWLPRHFRRLQRPRPPRPTNAEARSTVEDISGTVIGWGPFWFWP